MRVHILRAFITYLLVDKNWSFEHPYMENTSELTQSYLVYWNRYILPCNLTAHYNCELVKMWLNIINITQTAGKLFSRNYTKLNCL